MVYILSLAVQYRIYMVVSYLTVHVGDVMIM